MSKYDSPRLPVFSKEGKIILLLVVLLFLYLNFGWSTPRKNYILKTFHQAGIPTGAVNDGIIVPNDSQTFSGMYMGISGRYIIPNGHSKQVVEYYRKQLKSMRWGKTIYIDEGRDSNFYYWCSKHLHEGKNVMAHLYLPHQRDISGNQVFEFGVFWHTWMSRTSVRRGSACG